MEGLLSESERVEILEAATEKMKKESALDQNLDLKEIGNVILLFSIYFLILIHFVI